MTHQQVGMLPDLLNMLLYPHIVPRCPLVALTQCHLAIAGPYQQAGCLGLSEIDNS